MTLEKANLFRSSQTIAHKYEGIVIIIAYGYTSTIIICYKIGNPMEIPENKLYSEFNLSFQCNQENT